MDTLGGLLLGDRFRIGEPISRDGLVHVYSAHDVFRDAPATVHVIAAGWAADEDGRRELARAAMAASSLREARLVDALAAGALPDGRPYFATEHVGAKSLRDLVRGTGPLDCASVCAVISDVATALDALHRIGLVHHRLSASKVFVAADSNGEPICRVGGTGVGEMVRNVVCGKRITLDTNVYHHAAYIAPEAADVDHENHLADVYALASIAFELLAGRPPFEGQTAPQVMAAKATVSAPWLSTVAGHDFHPAIEAVIARGLAREPSQRYASAGSFASDFVLAVSTAARAPVSGVELDPYRLRLRIAAGLPRPDVSRLIRITPRSVPTLEPTSSAVPVARPKPPHRRLHPRMLMVPALVVLAGLIAGLPGIAPASNAPHAAFEETTFGDAPEIDPVPPDAADPRDAAVDELIDRGNAQLLRGFEDEAQVLFREALGEQPESPGAWRGLAMAYDLSGEARYRADAARAYRRYLAFARQPRDATRVRRRIEILSAGRSGTIRRPARAQAPRRAHGRTER